MNGAPTGTTLTSEPSTDWDRLRNLKAADIHAALESDSDAQPTNEDFWQNAKVVMPRHKEMVTIRLDADLMDWLRHQGKGYQTRINAILRAYMEAHRPHA